MDEPQNQDTKAKQSTKRRTRPAFLLAFSCLILLWVPFSIALGYFKLIYIPFVIFWLWVAWSSYKALVGNKTPRS
jgi:hypothetical protein